MFAVNGNNCVGYADSASGETVFHAYDPARNEELPTIFTQATVSETAEAVRKATDAFPVYAGIPLDRRVAFLHAVAAALRANDAALIEWFCRESGLSGARAAKELERSCFQFESYSDAVASGYALEAKIDPADSATHKPDLRKVNVPLGPVVVFGASNFPFAYSTIGGDCASALAAGCPVIVKAHPMHPHTSELSARIILSVAQEFGLPDGIFSHLHASDYTVGEALLKDPGVKAVGFTGSIAGGMALHRLAQGRPVPIPVYTEMGSSNPIMFTAAALEERGTEIAAQVAASIALDAGQFCTSPGLLFVCASSAEENFTQTLVSALSEVPLQPMLHPGIFDQYKKQAEKQIAGAEVLVEGVREATHIRPALVRVTGRQFLAEPFRAEEVFGSFATVIRCKNEAELEACLASLAGQLTASVYTGTGEQPAALLQAVQRFAGRIIVNGVPAGVTVTLAMQHGGPFPSSGNPHTTAVGADAIKRFMRPVSFQNCPDESLPEALKRSNPLGILRFVNGFATKDCC